MKTLSIALILLATVSCVNEAPAGPASVVQSIKNHNYDDGTFKVNAGGVTSITHPEVQAGKTIVLGYPEIPTSETSVAEIIVEGGVTEPTNFSLPPDYLMGGGIESIEPTDTYLFATTHGKICFHRKNDIKRCIPTKWLYMMLVMMEAEDD